MGCRNSAQEENEMSSANPSHKTNSSSDIQRMGSTLRMRLPRQVLEGGYVGSLGKSWLTRLQNCLLPKSTIKVETLTSANLSTAVLYARDEVSSTSKLPYAETELTTCRPTDDNIDKLVYQDSPFEIRVAGMLVDNFDLFSATNELLLYSVQTDPNSPGENGQGLPFMHFDHRSDAYANIESSNTYVPIPSSKAYVTGSSGRQEKNVDATTPKSGTDVKPNGEEGELRKSVNVQFDILELDSPDETINQSIAGIDCLGSMVGDISAIFPTLGMVSPAVSLAAELSKKALDSYAKPDKVLSVDMDFLLAEKARVRDGTAPNGEYLRYGYYFFLSEPTEAKLYASVLTPKNVQLMLRRIDEDEEPLKARRGRPVVNKKFFSLTKTNYLVVKVCEPFHTGEGNRKLLKAKHAKMLQEVLAGSNSFNSSNLSQISDCSS